MYAASQARERGRGPALADRSGIGDGHAPEERDLSEPNSGRRPPRSITRLALSNALGGIGARVSGLASGILLTPFVLARLGRELYGVTAFASSVIDYLMLMRAGMAEAMRRHVTVHHHAGDPSRARAYYAAGLWWGNLLRFVVLLVGIAVAAPVCSLLGLDPSRASDSTMGLILIIASVCLADLASAFIVPTYALGRMDRVAWINACEPWLRAGIILLALRLGPPTLTTYGSAVLAAELPGLIAFGILARRSGVVRSPLPRPTWGDAATRRALFGYGGLALVSQLAALLYISGSNLIVGAVYGAAAVTSYTLGTRWAPLVRGFVMAAVRPLTPLFTHLEVEGETEHMRVAVLRTVALTSALAVPLCLVPCVVGDLFLRHWIGAEYVDSALYMRLLLIPSVLELTLAPVWSALVARGRIAVIALGDLVASIVTIGAGTLLALSFGLGLTGFAIGNALALLAKNALLRPWLARRQTGLPSMRRVLGTLVRALLGALPVLLLLWWARPIYDGGLATVLAAGALGGGLCLVASAWAAVGPRQLREILRRARTRTPSVATTPVPEETEPY